MNVARWGLHSVRGYRIAQAAARVRADLAFALLDLCLTAAAYLLATEIVRDEGWGRSMDKLVAWLALVVVVNLAANVAFGLYGRMWRHASIDEARRVIAAGSIAGVVLGAAWTTLFGHPPVRLILLGTALTVLLVGAVRFRARLFAFQREPRAASGLNVAILGSRDMAATIIRDMRRFPSVGFCPTIALDDDPAVQGRTVAGVPVVGGIDDLPQRARSHGIHQALLAISSPSPEVVRRAAALSEEAEIPIRILPSMRELVGSHPTVRDVRDLRIEDLIGRTPVSSNLDPVRSLLANRRVLITGGGGSIGSEIARQVSELGPSELVLLDHDETHLHDALSRLSTSPELQLGDIRDRRAIFELFRSYRPEVVFHAAAHKHVPMLERFPLEAARTNVLGTKNTVDAAAATGVQRFVFLSTDKAVRPASVLGVTKWLGEQLVAASCPPGGSYCSVRFGNVVGSRGSVIPTFAQQIAAGGPVTVTDPSMTRFFMSISEAVHLVLQASVLAGEKDLFMLDMGEAINIMDLAHRMIHLSAKRPNIDIAINVTGPRKGEKTFEELRAADERVVDEPHPSIVRLESSYLGVTKLNEVLAELLEAVEQGSHEDASKCLRSMTAQASADASETAPRGLEPPASAKTVLSGT